MYCKEKSWSKNNQGNASSINWRFVQEIPVLHLGRKFNWDLQMCFGFR